MDKFVSQAKRISQMITGWRRDLHKIPELDLDLPETSAYVRSRLNELGISYKTFPGHSGIVGLIQSEAKDVRTVALRADMDALPILENSGVDFASTNGYMHACGHDAHMAMLLGAAALLSQNKKKIKGNVKLIFQPGEECSGGAQRMIDDGVLESPHVDVIFGQHVGMLSDELKGGHIGFLAGPVMASRDSFVITVRGKGCHGSTPAQGVDPVVVSAYLIVMLQSLVSRECNATDNAVITIGAIHGGEVYNIIPDEVVLKGAIRCVEENLRVNLGQRIREMCVGVSKVMRAECDIEYECGYPVTYNDPAATKFMLDVATSLLGEERVDTLKKPLMSSEDMSIFLKYCPGCFWFFAAPPKTGDVYSNHNKHFTINDEDLYLGSALMAAAAIEWLEKNP